MQFSTAMFYWTPEDGLFSQEISSLCDDPRVNIFERLYPDACDQGIILISAVSGKKATYYVDSTDTHHGEVAGWRLLPTPETIRDQPRLKNTKILIIND